MSPHDTTQLHQVLTLVGEELNVDRFPLKCVCARMRVLNTYTNGCYTALSSPSVLTLVTNKL